MWYPVFKWAITIKFLLDNTFAPECASMIMQKFQYFKSIARIENKANNWQADVVNCTHIYWLAMTRDNSQLPHQSLISQTKIRMKMKAIGGCQDLWG